MFFLELHAISHLSLVPAIVLAFFIAVVPDILSIGYFYLVSEIHDLEVAHQGYSQLFITYILFIDVIGWPTAVTELLLRAKPFGARYSCYASVLCQSLFLILFYYFLVFDNDLGFYKLDSDVVFFIGVVMYVLAIAAVKMKPVNSTLV